MGSPAAAQVRPIHRPQLLEAANLVFGLGRLRAQVASRGVSLSHFLLWVELRPTKRCVPARIPRTCNVILLFLIVTWKRDVCGWNSGEMTARWMGACSTPVTGVLRREKSGHRDTQGRRPGEDTGGSWSDAATSQNNDFRPSPEAGRGQGGRPPPPTPHASLLREHSPADTLSWTSGFQNHRE